MFTLGGMIGREADERALKEARLFDHPFVRANTDFLESVHPPDGPRKTLA